MAPAGNQDRHKGYSYTCDMTCAKRRWLWRHTSLCINQCASTTTSSQVSVDAQPSAWPQQLLSRLLVSTKQQYTCQFLSSTVCNHSAVYFLIAQRCTFLLVALNSALGIHSAAHIARFQQHNICAAAATVTNIAMDHQSQMPFSTSPVSCTPTALAVLCTHSSLAFL